MDDLGRVVTPVSVEHVLLPLDGSTFAAAAAHTARALATRFSAELLTISVSRDERNVARLRRHAANTLGRGADDRLRIAVGTDPAEAIAHLAANLPSCVICMSTRGRGRVTGALIGSVARAV